MIVQEPQEAEFEARFEAAPAIAVVIGVQVVMAAISRARDWQLWTLPWWVWLVPVVFEAPLVIALTMGRTRRWLEGAGARRGTALALFGALSCFNAAAVVALCGSILDGHETSGAALLCKGVAIWTIDVISFGIWFWALDRGGPVARLRSRQRSPDFQFPQMENPELAPHDWTPHLIDYLYVSFTNSIAFSPTDVMPLTRWAKLVMMIESGASALVVLLVTARAVNILR